MMYEGVLLFGVVFIAGYAFDTLTQSRHALTLRHARQFFLFVVIGLYFITCWRRSGQTLPMKAWNIRLVNSTGHRPTSKQMCLRYIFMWIIPLVGAGMIWILSAITGWPSVLMLIVLAPFGILLPTWLTDDQQFLHDKLASTLLISTKI